MRVLVLGGSGMLGHKLAQVLAPACETLATLRTLPPPWLTKVLPGVEFVHPLVAGDDAAVARMLDRIRPTVVVNCVGVTKQKAGGDDPVQCIMVNALFPHQIFRLCLPRGIRFITISTDCVFSGRKGRYTETDTSDAEDIYGKSKYVGEVTGIGALTIRTSIIGRELMHPGLGLIEWFLSNRGGTVNGYRRAIFSGLTTLELSRVILGLIKKHPSLNGLYHVAATPISKFDLLNLVNDRGGFGIGIRPDDTYVCDRSLDGNRFKHVTGLEMPPWSDMVHDMLQDSTPYDQLHAETGLVR